MKRIYGSIHGWAKRRNVARIRYALAVLIGLVAVVWTIGSFGFDSWQHCETKQHGQKVERDCSPVSMVDLIPLALLIGVIMWPELEELTIGNLISIRRRRAGLDTDNPPEEPVGPEADFRDAWADLDPWSRLPSRLASAEFREQLAAANPEPGSVKVRQLNSADRQLIKDLKVAPGFTAANAAAWADRSREELDSLGRVADRAHQASTEQYADGADAARRLLSELQELGLRL